VKSRDIVLIFLTVILAPTAAFIGIYGSTHHDGGQTALGVAIITFLGLIWGKPGSGSGGSGGTHAR
jgi:hypothetical protein